MTGPAPDGAANSSEPPHAVTIRDVAQAAHVSITTVSHVFNRPQRVAEPTRRRVFEAAADLAYKPNVHARQLVTRKSRSLAVQIAGRAVLHEHALVPNSEYFLEVLNGAARSADERGYALILTPSDVDPSTLDSFAVDGVLLIDPAGDEPIFDQRQMVTRIVTAGRPQAFAGAVFVVDNDHFGAAREVMDHLSKSGYRTPAVLVSDLTRSYVTDLIDGYRSWADEHSYAPIVIDVSQSESMAEAFDVLFDQNSDAVYACSEYLALDVLQEAQRRGLVVPDDLGLCSGVDSGVLQLTSPQVSGVYLHPREIGCRAIEVLIELAEGRAVSDDVRLIPADLAIRESTCRN